MDKMLQKPNIRRKLSKNAENCDHNIDPNKTTVNVKILMNNFLD
jgi:hypothetical protein